MKLIAALATAGLIAGCENADAQTYDYSYGSDDTPVAAKAGDTPLTNANGMTLYTFDKDTNGTSTCYDDCAVNWPPYIATAETADMGDGFAMVTRDDGTQQWAKDGAPLYLWIGDTAPGETNGDGVGGVWHAAY
ncbi:COG4315 family predicted lipoprotein [Yoonia sp. 2307UL14-13]|uniref:COG4315 family predicted lipoprotein n=1 Tax=Yoonia sp. 2307UL14-13 TaxID=3126506 RepID=UPI0030B511AF